MEGVLYARKRRPVWIGQLRIFPDRDAPGFGPMKPTVEWIEAVNIGRTDHGMIQPAAGRKGEPAVFGRQDRHPRRGQQAESEKSEKQTSCQVRSGTRPPAPPEHYQAGADHQRNTEPP